VANFPTSIYTPASKSAGQTIDAAFFNDPDAEITAIEQGYLQGTAPLNSSASTLASLSVTGGSTVATLNISGVSTLAGAVNLTSGQMIFPATQSAASGANTLDDYEEGTYVPTWTNGAIVNGAVGAAYVKVGQLCTVWITLAMGSGSTFGAGSAWTFSLPFTAANVNVNFYGVCQAYDASADTYYTGMVYAGAAGSTILLNKAASAVTASGQFNNAIPFTWATSDTLNICLTYRTAA
jgi:hypothetical protein